jgi:hypothetical protein
MSLVSFGVETDSSDEEKEPTAAEKRIIEERKDRLRARRMEAQVAAAQNNHMTTQNHARILGKDASSPTKVALKRRADVAVAEAANRLADVQTAQYDEKMKRAAREKARLADAKEKSRKAKETLAAAEAEEEAALKAKLAKTR